MDKVLALTKRRGFVFPSSEIYGGLAGCYDYGPVGVALKRLIRDDWWRAMVSRREDVVGIETSILMAAKVWEVSGHATNFHDPMVDCKKCKARFRADQIAESQCPERPSKQPGRVRRRADRAAAVQHDVQDAGGRRRGHVVDGLPAPRDGAGHVRQLQERARDDARQGAVRHRAAGASVPQRDRRAQPALPHARVRADGDGVLLRAGHGGRVVRRTGSSTACSWWKDLGVRASHLRLRDHEKDELAHYARACSDIEYLYPFGWKEVEGVASRGDFDLKAHQAGSGKGLAYLDEATKQWIVPCVVEPAVGVDRCFLAVLADAFEEEVKANGETRVVLHLHPKLAPTQVGVYPARQEGRDAREGPRDLRGAARHVPLRLRRGRDRRQALRPRRRGRHAVRRHDRLADDHRRHRHGARPRHDGAGSRARSGALAAYLAETHPHAGSGPTRARSLGDVP